MLLALCATLTGADTFADIRLRGRKKLDSLRPVLPIKTGISSHDTLSDVMNALDPADFSDCFVAWVAGLHEGEPDTIELNA